MRRSIAVPSLILGLDFVLYLGIGELGYLNRGGLIDHGHFREGRSMSVQSLLDTDLYKLSMGQAALFGRRCGISYADCNVTYDFINRGQTKFPKGFAEQLKREIYLMSRDCCLMRHEEEYLRSISFFKPAYIDYLRRYRFNQNQVVVHQNEDGELDVKIHGPWHETILWEVPLLATISELYYSMSAKFPDDQTLARMAYKAARLGEAGVPVADFGTRRRFSYKVQKDLVKTFHAHCKSFVGTSNVDLAMKYGVKAIGTHAHEWFSFHAALFGYRLANYHALEAWVDEYQGDLGIALTDTFTTDVFWRDFGPKFAKLFDGCRHDSGDPYKFGERVIEHYKSLGIDPLTKTIVFSDGLNVETACSIRAYFEGKIKTAFGIGTHLTADCGHTPLNMVIKLVEVEYGGQKIKTVKLSDVPGKETGDREEIEICKKIYGLK